ncbi:MAG: epoxyqueuosine reductase QueH, partial [Endomicrobium sp.]|nr:epoxyqueuosine reductase QueH [Endomicrobium sp.]
MKTRILLHICCAPCSASAVDILKDDCEISFYWHNPNIWPLEEFEKRKETAVNYAKELGFEFFEEEDFAYDYPSWKSKSLELCGLCYEIRLKKAALFAKNNDFDFFST